MLDTFGANFYIGPSQGLVAVDWEKRMEEEWGRAFAHESGHALMAVLQGIPCHGICFEKGDPQGRFCALTPLYVSGAMSEKDYLVLAAGAAAERVIYGNNDGEGARADERAFGTDAPTFRETMAGAFAILMSKRRQLRRLVSLLKAKARQVDFDLGRLPEMGMDCSESRYLMLLSREDLETAVRRA